MATTTLGVKVDESLRERLRVVAEQRQCTPHWLHKQALISLIEKIERGEELPELNHLFARQDEQHPHEAAEAFSVVPFYEFAQDVQPQSVLRAAITAAYRRPETECLPMLVSQAGPSDAPAVRALATRLVETLRGKRKGGGVEALIQEFSLSTQEGIALMCLAEALLRIPDRATRDALIRDKIAYGDWKSHLGASPSMFVNAATWGLVLTGKLVSQNSEKNLSNAMSRLISKGGEPVIRQGVNMAMRLMGEQFVTGQVISEALANSAKMQAKGFRYSYDMLGEAATTQADAKRYFLLYEQAIHAIGKASAARGIYEGPGISIKLSALHPRYSRAQRDRVMTELLPNVVALARLARQYDIGINIDAEEADRLELSLDILEALCFDNALAGWNGIGFVVQAYQKRAPFVLDYLIDLARRSRHRLMVRLVKGAYWDSEIKRAQQEGLEGYPVYTRKIYSDVSYLACARKLLSVPEAIYPQFATHNAYSVAAIYEMAGQNYYAGQYEFQCLHGMGEPLYEEVTGPVTQGKLGRPCRIYAPVGSHETLLAYLVRRLLENGSNSSFVNQINDDAIFVRDLVSDPVEQAMQMVPVGRPHDRIPLPRELFGPLSTGARPNSEGLDLSNEHRLGSLSAALLHSASVPWRATPILADEASPSDAGAQETLDHASTPAQTHPVLNPANHQDVVGHVTHARPDEVTRAFANAVATAPIWQATPATERASYLVRAADMLEAEMQTLIGLLVREAGKSFTAAIAEVREAVDFLRYYAEQASETFSNDTHRALGPVVCISPWNFPLAIFTGQIAAALASGNVVLAKPAEQTCLIAAQAVRILHAAGVATGALQLLPGAGESVGTQLIACPDLRGVMFTGSTEVARLIAAQLSDRLDDQGQPIVLIAETGGQNAMVVDSSALAEQVVADVLASAFDSAGQRCSALRVLCLQEDSADHVLTMLRGALQELRVDLPDRLSSDVGPVIDAQARDTIEQHIASMDHAGYAVTRVPLGTHCKRGTFVAPALIEIDSLDVLKKEVFGPVLHVLRYRRDDMDALIDRINATGYGLTFGVHSRIDETIERLTSRIRAGNIYINRNIVGAVVGVQPFGGQGLSGTGPKAGGPLYMLRLLASRPAELPEWSLGLGGWPRKRTLTGPTGEYNTYSLMPRGVVLCVAHCAEGMAEQWNVTHTTGCRPVWLDNACARAWLAENQPARTQRAVVAADQLDALAFDVALFEGDTDALRVFNQRMARRSGPLVTVLGMTAESLARGEHYMPDRLLHEQSTSVNTAAAGGNASLMTLT